LTALGVGRAILAQHVQHTGKGQVKVTQLSQRHIIEKLDGKEPSATVLEVTFEPGQKDTPHRHAGPVFGYVLEGEYEHAINDEPIKSYKAGDTFYEPTGPVHRVAQNPSAKTRTRLLAVSLRPRYLAQEGVTLVGCSENATRPDATRRTKFLAEWHARDCGPREFLS
jgi:quercetin dioxygenase-like cupin family protein